MTLTETTANKLIQLIKDRHLNPGDKLPTEVDLSQQLDVGRNTLTRLFEDYKRENY